MHETHPVLSCLINAFKCSVFNFCLYGHNSHPSGKNPIQASYAPANPISHLCPHICNRRKVLILRSQIIICQIQISRFRYLYRRMTEQL